MSWKDKIGETRQVIEEALKLTDKPSAIAYSGGKDAIVVAHILKEYGINNAIVDLSFYFSKQSEDVINMAEAQGLNYKLVQTLFWKHMTENSEMYFPQKPENKYIGIQQRQWKSIPQGIKHFGCDLVFYGRRVGENNARNYINPFKSKGFTAIYPIRLWTTLEVWEYMRDNNLAIPWIYRSMFSQYLNNAPWNTLIGSKLWCWDVVYNTEKEVLYEAQKYGLQSANEYLSLPENSPLKSLNTFKQSWFSKESSTISPYKVYGIEMPQSPDDGITKYRNQ